MNDDVKQPERLPEPVGRALRRLPSAEAADGFTAGVLARIDPAAAARGRTRARRTASALAALIATGALAGAGVRHANVERAREARLAEIDAERERLARELDEIRRLSRAPLPVVYLGGDEEVDLVIDPRALSRRAALTASPTEPDRWRNDR